MTDDRDFALIHAEIDGELKAAERGELARRLLANPGTRAVRDELRRLCETLEAIPAVEPPAQLRTAVFAALPPSSPRLRRVEWSHSRWRYAAVLAGMLLVGGVLFSTLDGQRPGSAELVGTMAAPRAQVTLDVARLEKGSVTGQVTLYRDAQGLGLGFDLSTNGLVDVVVASGGHMLRVNGLDQKGGRGVATRVALAGFETKGPQTVNLTFLSSGHAVGSATLRATADH